MEEKAKPMNEWSGWRKKGTQTISLPPSTNHREQIQLAKELLKNPRVVTKKVEKSKFPESLEAVKKHPQAETSQYGATAMAKAARTGFQTPRVPDEGNRTFMGAGRESNQK